MNALQSGAGRIRRRWKGQRWITCELQFNGRKARVMEPGLYTHLFFLDEATALAAGHRPCAECRRPAFNAFLAAWAAGNPEVAPERRIRIGEVDRVLHAERTGPRGRAPTSMAMSASLNATIGSSVPTMPASSIGSSPKPSRIATASAAKSSTDVTPRSSRSVRVTTPSSIRNTRRLVVPQSIARKRDPKLTTRPRTMR